MKTFKIHCHAISEIMDGTIGLTELQEAKLQELAKRKNDPTAKPLTAIMEAELADLIHKKNNPQLPAGAKTYCKKWLKKALYNRDENWKALVIDKGLACEQDSINLLGKVRGLDGIYKNDEYFESDYIKGSPDILYGDYVRDVKSSWDLFTFPMFDDKLPNKDYWWQLQGYMILTGKQKASLDYVLIDTPMPLVMLDLKKLYYQSGGVAEDWTPERYEYHYPNYRFDDIPEEKRVKSFEFEIEQGLEAKINERVELCRKYIAKLLEP